MSPSSLQPIGTRQQAASLSGQVREFAGSRKGAAAAAAILLAGGGYAYLQQVQAQQKKARERYVGDKHPLCAAIDLPLGPLGDCGRTGSGCGWSLAASNPA